MSASLNGLLILAVVLAGLAAIAAALSLTVGRSLARRSRLLAVSVCGLAVPAVLVVVGYVEYAATRNNPGDMAPMALGAFLIVAALSAPVGLLASWLALRRR